jgi:hypothetical protein
MVGIDSDSDKELPVAQVVKPQLLPASLAEFSRCVIKRRDLAKWIELEAYREGITHAYVKVVYHRKYALARIEGFTQTDLSYKVE